MGHQLLRRHTKKVKVPLLVVLYSGDSKASKHNVSSGLIIINSLLHWFSSESKKQRLLKSIQCSVPKCANGSAV